MNSSNYFRVNTPNVIHEVIDGEAILINCENGSYYSIDKVGADIWSLIESGVAVSHIINVIAQQYEGSQEDIENGVYQLIKQLQQETLIVPDQERDVNSDAGLGADLNRATINGRKPGFERPVLHAYTDMEDLILLDPIHEVDERGWPHLPENA